MIEDKPKATISWTPAQRTVLDTIGKNMLVSASAGSGKTTIMIEKIIKLICDFKVPITNFLIVTFTKASAQDMKQKLIEKLKESQDEFVKSQIQNVAISDISNLHSFCSRLISTYFYEIGIDPAYIIIDEDQEKLLNEKALKRLFEKHEQINDESFFELFRIFNNKRSDKDLKEILIKLNKFKKVSADDGEHIFDLLEKTHCEDFSKNICVKIVNESICEKIADQANEVEFFARRCFDFDEPKLYEHFTEIATNLKTINKSNSFKTNATNLFDFKMAKSPSPQQQKFLSNEAKFIKEKIKKLLDKCKAFCVSKDEEEIRQGIIYSKKVLLNLLKLTNEFDDIYKKYKAEMCGLDFNDLEAYAIKILENESIAQEIRSKYKYVFVDEYQDINEIQEKIITLISSKNNRFMVGDVKQSIYGFRLCDPDMFVQKYELYGKESDTNKLVKLNDNFRSHKHILDFVNKIFAGVMTERFGNINYKKDAMLVAGKKWEDDEPSVEICVIKKKRNQREPVVARGVYSVLNHTQQEEEEILRARQEAKIVAEKIKQLKGKYPLNEIAILVARRNKIVDEIIRVLGEEKIKISSDSTYNLLERPYIDELVNFAKFCVNQDDDFLLFKTLKSSLFNFTDEELVTLRLTDLHVRFFETINLENEIDDEKLRNKVENFKSKVSMFISHSKLYPIKKFIKIILDEFKLREIAYTYEDGEQRNDDFDKFILQLPNTSVVDFCLNFSDAFFKQSNSSGGDCVQMMTIHGAKGMEFKVVFVMNINDKLEMSNLRDKVIFNKYFGLATNFVDEDSRQVKSTLPRSLVQIAEERKTLEEQQRLLYVALTRAIRKMYVICSANLDNFDGRFPETPTMFFDWFKPIIFEDLQGKKYDFCKISYVDPSNEDKGEDKAKSVIKIEPIKLKAEPSWFNYKYATCQNIPLKNSISKILSMEEEQERFEDDEKTSFSNSSADRGTAYHKFLSKINFYDLNDIQNQVETVYREKTDEQDKKFINKSTILKIFERADIFNVSKSDLVLQEREFLAKVSAKIIDKNADGEFMLQGIIDLAIIKQDQIILADYKTGKIDNEKLKRYKFQLEAYASVLAKIYKTQKIGKFLIFLDEQKIIEI